MQCSVSLFILQVYVHPLFDRFPNVVRAAMLCRCDDCSQGLTRAKLSADSSLQFLQVAGVTSERGVLQPIRDALVHDIWLVVNGGGRKCEKIVNLILCE